MPDKRPVCVLIAGPNGSGKSSITQEYKNATEDFPSLYINADEIQKKYSLTDKEAQTKAEEIRQGALERGESFASETVMSHISKIDVLRHAREKGYETRLLYITTQDPEVNKDRVADRVSKGGHNVPEERIEPRYWRSMSYLPLALKYSDRASVYNNTFDNPLKIYEHSPEKGEKRFPQPPPSHWSDSAIKRLTELPKEAITHYQQHVDQEKGVTKGPGR